MASSAPDPSGPPADPPPVPPRLQEPELDELAAALLGTGLLVPPPPDPSS